MRLATSFLAFLTLAGGQQNPPPAFEVATVKVNASGPLTGNGFSPTPGRLRVTNCTLEQIIQASFHVKKGLLFGMAAWMKSDRYDIDAKATGKSDFDEDLVLLRSLLADRFHLRFHVETRQMKTQHLVFGKGGLKIQ